MLVDTVERSEGREAAQPRSQLGKGLANTGLGDPQPVAH